MNRNQGATIGAILLAGLLMRPIGGNSPFPSVDSKAAAASASTTESNASHSEGPWIASCNYWSPVRSDSGGKNEEGELSATLKVGRESADWRMQVEQDKDAGETTCGREPNARWGLPSDKSNLNLKTMIALVPDPVHTHGSLGFDRTIDTIVEAAEDNEYTSSYYWLPWKNPIRTVITSGDKEPGHDPEREREPGLIIFKHVPTGSEDPAPKNSYYKAVYLFLIGESAVDGIDADQMKRALNYQEQLQEQFFGGANSGGFSRGRGKKVFIVGPNNTGSAASLRATLDAHFKGNGSVVVKAVGTTSSQLAENQLASTSGPTIEYASFNDDGKHDREKFKQLLNGSGGEYDPERVFELVEDNTARGQSALRQPKCVAYDDKTGTCLKYEFDKDFTVLRYPREISLLRNAQTGSYTGASGSSSSIPSPYLQLSLKDTTPEDSVPHFSRDDTPLSQEAELMTIARTLNKSRAQFVLITGNIVDSLFLMQFLHRACPDVRLLFMGGDLLLEREVDNVPYIGSITVAAYPLIGTGQSQRQNNNRPYPDAGNLAYYNAISYSFWDPSLRSKPVLAGYSNPLEEKTVRPPLWETVIGSDGYYPLAILDECSSDANSVNSLPALDSDGEIGKVVPCQPPSAPVMRHATLPMHPSLLWNALCIAVAMLCVFHFAVMLVADYWSPFTRDLSIRDNVEPGRRSMYVRIGTAMLSSMAFAVSFPLFPLRGHLLQEYRGDYACAMFALLAGLAAALITAWKTRGNLNWKTRKSRNESSRASEARRKNNLCFLVSLLALVALLGFPISWACLCLRGQPWGGEQPTYAGLLFAYRCIHPESGISPVVPVSLLLLGWYLWAFCQTARLRFSMESRPVMPAKVSPPSGFFVADEDLALCRSEKADCGNPRSSCLYSNLTCILITRQIVRRFWRTPRRTPDAILGCFYLGLLATLLWTPPMHSLEGLVRLTHFLDMPRLYERLVVLLFFPLLFISLAGWLRMILIWGSLRRSLLERLENYPIRFAFSQLRDTGWMNMVQQGGLQEWWRDMARSSESMRQMLNDKHLKAEIEKHSGDPEKEPGAASRHSHAGPSPGAVSAGEIKPWEVMQQAQAEFEECASVLTSRAKGERNANEPAKYEKKRDYEIMHEIEETFGKFAKGLLTGALIPYWKRRTQRFVESEDGETLPIKAKRSEMHTEGFHQPVELHASRDQSDPIHIRIAEEFLAIRYVSLIRSVLVNMRRLMSFVTASFVLAIIAWNSYPFEPRQFVDWIFTALLFVLGVGIVCVLAQMYRNPILSRITDTKANELGFEFWARLISLGAIPLVTWLAYTFPDVGSFLFKFLDPWFP